MSINFSAIILAKNEAENIGRCLDSLNFCDEVIVIDDASIDKTAAIAKKKGAKVFTKKLKGNFAQQRNFALKKAKGQWLLFVDADEVIPPGLAQEIKTSIRQKEVVTGYYLIRRDFLFGRQLKYGESGQNKLLRLAKKGSGKWQRSIHETWIVKGKTKILKESLIHYPHPTIREFVEHLNFHTSLHAKENLNEGKKPTLLKVIFYPILKFIHNFILKKGFLDGTEGFLAASFMSWHSFLAWSKAWLAKN